jgi:hypothetical protein
MMVVCSYCHPCNHSCHSYDSYDLMTLMTIVMVVAAICCCYQLVPCFEQLYYCHLIHWGCQVAMATWGWLWVFGSALSLYSALFKSTHSIMQKCRGNVFKDAKHQLRGKVSLFVCFFVKICQFMSFLCSSRCKHSCSNSQMAESLWKEIPMGSNESILGPGPLFNKWLSLVYRYGYRQRTSVKQRGKKRNTCLCDVFGFSFFLGTLSLYSAGCMLHDFLVPFFIAGLR